MMMQLIETDTTPHTNGMLFQPFSTTNSNSKVGGAGLPNISRRLRRTQRRRRFN